MMDGKLFILFICPCIIVFKLNFTDREFENYGMCVCVRMYARELCEIQNELN